MKRAVFFLFFISLVPSCTAQEAITVIDIDTFTKAIASKEVQLIDIRTPEEYQKGYIAHAVNINYYDDTQFTTRIQQLDVTQPIYIYCHSGWRSHRASKKLAAMGFQNIYDFKGGYKAWSAQQSD